MGLTNFTHGVSSFGMPMLGSSVDLLATGKGVTYWVKGDGGNDLDDGLSPDTAFRTLTRALAKATASHGDIILIMPQYDNGAVTTTKDSYSDDTPITISKAGIKIYGLGCGKEDRPNFNSIGTNDDAISVEAADITIAHLEFTDGDASSTGAALNIAAARCHVYGCSFTQDANTDHAITLTAGGDEAWIEKCYFQVTANGPLLAIKFEAAGCNLVRIEDNIFDGGGDTNVWDTAAVGAAAAITYSYLWLLRNYFMWGGAVFAATGSATGLIAYNCFGEGTLGSMLDPGVSMCVENYETDAADESARLFPATTAS